MPTLAPRGTCAGRLCNCPAWAPVPDTLRDTWPTCQDCPHSRQTHRKIKG